MQDSARPLLSVQNLKTYFKTDEGTVKAVDGVSFEVYPGEVVGIVGESGCGKSVTARSILGIVERPGRVVEGQILFRLTGKGAIESDEVIDLAKLNPSGPGVRTIRGSKIALIPQEPMTAFSPVHTIGNQMIETIMLHRGLARREARQVAIEMLRKVGIPMPEQRIDAYAWELSGGLRQRTLIAIALSCNPLLLIADEPTTALDVTTQAQILSLIRELQREYSLAVILITHNLGVIAEMASKVVVMYLGRAVETGPVDEIFHSPKHPYTQALLRSIPSVLSKPRVRLPSIKGSIPHPFNRPQGCPFHPRCPSFIEGVCDRRVPNLLPVGDKHNVSCFLYHKE